MTSGGSGRECWFRWELPDTIIADVVEGLCAAFWPNSKPGSPADTGVQR
jgi:hypothetical protein